MSNSFLKREEYDENQFGLMDTAILELMDSTGMAVNQIVDLTFGDYVNSIESNYSYYDVTIPNDTDEIGRFVYEDDDLEGEWLIEDTFYFTSSYESMYAIWYYLISERDQVIPLEEPLFQQNDKKITENYILNLLEGVTG